MQGTISRRLTPRALMLPSAVRTFACNSKVSILKTPLFYFKSGTVLLKRTVPKLIRTNLRFDPELIIEEERADRNIVMDPPDRVREKRGDRKLLDPGYLL